MRRKVVRAVVASVTTDLALTLHKAAALAASAERAAGAGETDRAVADLLELEPLIHDARGLTRAAALLHRRAADRTGEV